jgi:2-oxoglutarate dehydrogenase E2 component (dihydrolipoamide succinyltransferase)
MATSVTMPQLGESVTEGTVTRWLKQVGDHVSADEPLLEVSTDKVDTEIPSPASGILTEIMAGEDDVVEVGGELAVISAESEAGAAPAPAAPAPAAPAPAAPAPAAPAPAAPAPAAPAPAQQPPAQAGGGEGVPVELPALGESVTEGTVTRWLKQVGEEVAVDEPLLEVSTDKVDTEIPSPAAGILTEIRVNEDETVDVGSVLAVIGGSAPTPAAAEPAPTPAAAEPALTPQPETAAPTPEPEPARAPATAPAPAAPAEGVYVTPIVRKLANEKGVDLSAVTGTGVGGRIRKQDVLAAAAANEAAARPAPPVSAPAVSAPPATAPAPAAPAPDRSHLRGRTEAMTRLRKVIASRMVDSLAVSAQLTTVVEVDVTRIALLRDRVKDDFLAREGVKLSFMPFFAKATCEALKQFPQLNASLDAEGVNVTYHDSENLGVAVDTERGLLVPVIARAGDLNIAGLARKIAELADRTRTNKLSPDELAGGTFTLTNTGSRGALFDTPIINQPQVGILGTGAVVKRPIIVTDETGSDAIAIRRMMYLALTYDHRLVDGADAARFLSFLKQRLESGDFENDL